MTKWRKSSYSEGSVNGGCVEVAWLLGGVGLRDSKDPDGPAYQIPRSSFAELLEAVKTDRYKL